MKPRVLAETIIPIVVMLFFLQALRVIFSVMFGFIYDQVIEGPANAWLVIGNLLVIASMLMPAWVDRSPGWEWMSAAAFVSSAARVALSINDPWVRYWGALLIIASAGVLMVPLIRLDIRRFLRTLIIAIVLEQLLRVVGHTMDVSLEWATVPVLAVWIAALLTLTFWFKPWSETSQRALSGISWGVGAAIGGFLFLETSLLGLPNAISRWAEVSYMLTAPALIVITILPLYPGVLSVARNLMASKFVRFMVAVILIGGLLLGYFLSGIWALAMLLIGQLVLLGVLLMLGELAPPEHSSVGGRLALGLATFLALNFLNAFAFTYAYTLPSMRALGWVVYLAAGALVAWGLSAAQELKPDHTIDEGAFRLALTTMLALGIALASIWPASSEAMPDGTRRFASYNIHYGYDDDWHTTLPEIATALKEARVDVVALQEVDTGRMTSYSTDNAYYLARTLGMKVFYLPTIEHLTGIAVLYKGEALDRGARWLPSLQEQTGIIEIVLPWQDDRLHSYATWMGLSDEDTMGQARAALEFIGSNSPATFAGDFNAVVGEPEMQAIQAAGFVDPFTELGQVPAPPTSPAVEPRERIDYVWLRGLEASQAWVSESLDSDHRLVIVEVNQP